MDFPQVLISIVVIVPLLLWVAISMRRRPPKRAPLSTLQPSPVHLLPRMERTASRSTTVVRELTLSAKYERALALLIKQKGWKGTLCQLPALPPFFISRRSELSRALAFLDASHPPRVLAITSARETAGVGRTGFAAVLAHLVAERFPDGQLHLDLRGDEHNALDVVEAMRQIVWKLNPGAPMPTDLAELPARYQQSLEKRRVLLLVDNVKPQPYLELLQPPEGSLLILTSREPTAFTRVETITLEPFSRPESRLFLRSAGGRISRETDIHLDLLAELSGYLPAPLRLNADRFHADAARPIDWLFDQLKKADAFKNPLEAARSLAVETATSAKAVADIASLPLFQQPAAQPASDEQGEKPGSWDSARAFVQRFQSRTEAAFSLTDVPAAFAEPSRGPAPDYPDALRLLANFPSMISERAPKLAWLEAAVSAARALGDRPAETRAVAMLGKARAQSGEPRLAVACFERWVEFTREAGDRRAEADALGWLGVGWSGSGLDRRAMGCFEAQLQISREIGDRKSEVSALGKLGQAKATLGDFQKSATLHADQLRIAMDIGDRASELEALENLGLAWTRLKEIEKAAGFHESLLTAARATGDLSAESRALGHLGQVAVHRGQIDDAIEKYEAQLTLANRIADLVGQSHAHASLGVAWARRGDLQKAVAHYEEQLRIAQQMSNRLGEATAHSNIGSGLERLGNFAGAIAAWEKALAIYESLSSPSADTMRRWLERVRNALAGNGAHH